jgi:hypothetical protein
MLVMQALGFLLELAPSRAQAFQQVETFLNAPVHPDARLLLACWRECVPAGGFVVGRDIPSRRLGKLLGNIALYEYCGDSKDFRVRLAGFSFMRRFGRDITGRLLREALPGEVHARHCAAFLSVLETGVPFSLDVKIRSPERPLMHFEILALRATASDGCTALLLSGQFYFERVSRHR